MNEAQNNRKFELVMCDIENRASNICGSSDVRLSKEDTALIPSLPLPSPNIMRERRGRTGTDTKKDIVVSQALAHTVLLYWTLQFKLCKDATPMQ